eukprot:gene17593-27082_t
MDVRRVLSEVQQLYRQFMNEVPSGFIPKPEFGTLCQVMGIREGAIRELVFSAFDLNGDGYISFSEFIRAMSTMTRGSADEKLNFAFHLYDTGGDGGRPRGYLTKSDLLRVVNSLRSMLGDLLMLNGTTYNTPDALVDAIFLEMDLNRDGKITEEEYRVGAKRDQAIVQGLALF